MRALRKFFGTVRGRSGPATDHAPPDHTDLPVPLHTDAAWRPDAWSRPLPEMTATGNGAALTPDLTLFHDCPHPDLAVGQVPEGGGPGRSALALDVVCFRGSFLSLALELPAKMVRGLGRQRVLQVDLTLSHRAPVEILARLNVTHGPNTEQMLRSFDRSDRGTHAEFDLAYSSIRERRVERAWIDLIFTEPQTDRIVLHDLIVSRRLRAEL